MEEGLAAIALEPPAGEPEQTRRTNKEKYVKSPVQESSSYYSSKGNVGKPPRLVSA